MNDKISLIQHPRNGIQAVKMTKARKVYSRHCAVGDIVAVEEQIGSQRTIMPPQDGLSGDHAEYLIKCGVAVAHTVKPGDKLISVRPAQSDLPGDEPKVETATLPQVRRAEQGTARPQRGAV